MQEAFQDEHARGPWGMADSEFPLALTTLCQLQTEHERDRGRASFIESCNGDWERITADAVQPAFEIEGTVTSKRTCMEIVSEGCLRDLVREVPQLRIIKGILKALVAPVGQDLRGHQVVIEVASGGNRTVVCCLACSKRSVQASRVSRALSSVASNDFT